MDFTNFFHTEILTGLFFSTNTGFPTRWLEVCVVLCWQIFLNFRLLAQGTPKQNALGKFSKSWKVNVNGIWSTDQIRSAIRFC